MHPNSIITYENLSKYHENICDLIRPAYAEYTGSSTDVEVTTLSGYFPSELVEGSKIIIKINGSITTIKTLNVNNTGEKNVYYKGSSLASNVISKYNIYEFVYDGAYYRILGIDTNTHYIAKNVITVDNTTETNSAATNGNVHLNVIENSAIRSSHKIVGTGGTKVTSDENGNITIDSDITYSIVNHNSDEIECVILPNTFHIWNEVLSLDISLGEIIPGVCNEFLFQFTSGDQPTMLMLPDDIKWINDFPDIESNKTYQCSIINNIGIICGV